MRVTTNQVKVGVGLGLATFITIAALSGQYVPPTGIGTTFQRVANNGALVESGVIRPTGVTGALDNWAPTGIATARTVYATLTGDATLSSIAAGQSGDGRVIELCATGAFTLTLKSDDGSTGTAANRLAMPNALDWQLGPTGNACVGLRYDGTLARWKVDSKTGTTYPGFVDTGSSSFTGEQAFSTTGQSDNIALGSSVSVLRYTGSGTATLTGFTGGTNGRVLFVVNESGNTVTLGHQTGSSASNQITSVASAGTSLGGTGGAFLRYDGSTSRWRVLAWGTTTFNSITNGGALSLNSNCASSVSGTLTGWTPGSCFGYRLTTTGATTLFSLTSGAGQSGRLIRILNLGTFNLTVKNDDGTTGTAGERFINAGAVDLVVPPGSSTWAMFDTTGSRWYTIPGVGCYSQASNTLLGYSGDVPRQSGRYYFEPAPSGVSTTAASGNGTLRCASSYIPNTATLVRLGAEVTIVGEAGSKVRLCVYGDDGTGRPGSLVVDGGQIAGDSATVQEVTVSSAVGPGRYWFCGGVQSAPTTQPTIRTSVNTSLPADTGTTLPGASAISGGFTMTGVSGACSGTFTVAGSTGTLIRLLARY